MKTTLIGDTTGIRGRKLTYRVEPPGAESYTVDIPVEEYFNTKEDPVPADVMEKAIKAKAGWQK